MVGVSRSARGNPGSQQNIDNPGNLLFKRSIDLLRHRKIPTIERPKIMKILIVCLTVATFVLSPVAWAGEGKTSGKDKAACSEKAGCAETAKASAKAGCSEKSCCEKEKVAKKTAKPDEKGAMFLVKR